MWYEYNYTVQVYYFDHRCWSWLQKHTMLSQAHFSMLSIINVLPNMIPTAPTQTMYWYLCTILSRCGCRAKGLYNKHNIQRRKKDKYKSTVRVEPTANSAQPTWETQKERMEEGQTDTHWLTDTQTETERGYSRLKQFHRTCTRNHGHLLWLHLLASYHDN